jgi:hypothetical protein
VTPPGTPVLGVACLAFLVCAAGASAGAQLLSPPHYMEYRADVIAARTTAVEAGLGLVVPFGTYVRLGVDGAAGASWHAGAAHAAGRVDAVGRFLLDPFREVPLGLSLGAGLSVPYLEGDRVRPYATAVVDLEGRPRGAFTPAVQIGLGGGARLGVALRTQAPRWR